MPLAPRESRRRTWRQEALAALAVKTKLIAGRRHFFFGWSDSFILINKIVLFLAVKKVVDKLGVQAERAPREGVVLRSRRLYY